MVRPLCTELGPKNPPFAKKQTNICRLSGDIMILLVIVILIVIRVDCVIIVVDVVVVISYRMLPSTHTTP